MATTYRLNCCPMPGGAHADFDHEEFNPQLPNGQKTKRLFTPSVYPQYGTPTDPPSEIVVYSCKQHIPHLRCSTSYAPFNPKIEEDTLVISIDGKARREGTTLAQAVSARYFGPDSDYTGLWCTVLDRRANKVIKEKSTVLLLRQRRNSHTSARALSDGADEVTGGDRGHEPAYQTVTCMREVSLAHPSLQQRLLLLFLGRRHRRAHGFPANEELPNGVSAEDYRVAHHNFRLLEEKNIAILLWKVDEHLMPEPGRLANEYLDLLEYEVEEQRWWEQASAQYLFMMLQQQMMQKDAEDGSQIGHNEQDEGLCICPDCNPEAARVVANESQER